MNKFFCQSLTCPGADVQHEAAFHGPVISGATYHPRCLSGVIFEHLQYPHLGKHQKRCCLPIHGEKDHLWVSATDVAGTALVIRWDGMGVSNEPREVLVAS